MDGLFSDSQLSSPRIEPKPGQHVPAPLCFRRVKSKLPRAVVVEASNVLKMVGKPDGLWVGMYVTRCINGKVYAFMIEWHKHALSDNVPDGLKKWHRGVSVFEPE